MKEVEFTLEAELYSAFVSDNQVLTEIAIQELFLAQLELAIKGSKISSIENAWKSMIDLVQIKIDVLKERIQAARSGELHMLQSDVYYMIALTQEKIRILADHIAVQYINWEVLIKGA